MTTPSQARASSATASAGGAGAGSSTSFFVQERERLITEIADGLESLLGNVNTLNRKLEESIAVGQEFEPIANLWGPFVDILSASGLQPPPTQQTGATTPGHSRPDGSTQHRQQRSSSAAGRASSTHLESDASYAVSSEPILSSDGAVENTLPPGVAPGGGIVYGRG